MEDEFRIREKIIRDIESTSEDELRESGADSDLYRGAGEGLDSVDSDAEKPIRDTAFEIIENTVLNQRRAELFRQGVHFVLALRQMKPLRGF